MIKKLLITAIFGLSLFAEALSTGGAVPTMSIKDQFEKEHTIGTKVKTIIFSATKEESNTIKEFLNSKGNDFLITNNIAYVADITGMPSLITKFIALPKMKNYSFPILLVDENHKILFPVEKDKITIITLDNSKITDVKFIKTSQDLAATFK